MQLIRFIRLILTLAVSYFFLYDYLGKKYLKILSQRQNINKINENQQQKVEKVLQYTSNSLLSKDINIDKIEKINSQFISIEQFEKKYDQGTNNIFDSALKSFKKKVNNYIFTFYNWYRIQIKLIDLQFDSYFEFIISQQKRGSVGISEKVAFKIPEKFYAHKQNDEQSLNVNFNTKDFSINILQIASPQLFGNQQNDGYVQEKLLYLSTNKSKITQNDFKKFGSSKTVTKFKISLIRKDFQIKANLTHVIRHNQCFTNQNDNFLKHKCLGGYANGKINFLYFQKKIQDQQNGKIVGDWKKQTFNLDNNRARATFIGYRSVNNYLKNIIPKFDFNHPLNLFNKPLINMKTIQIDFLGFNKLQYYAKFDNIQKQRWVGMTLTKRFYSHQISLQADMFENYFFINGNIHPIYKMKQNLPLNKQDLKIGSIIHLSNNVSENSRTQRIPSFDIQFRVFNISQTKQNGLFNKRSISNIVGFWSGWIDEASLFEKQQQLAHYKETQQYLHVNFYNITGAITFTQQIF